MSAEVVTLSYTFCYIYSTKRGNSNPVDTVTIVFAGN